MPAKPNKQRRVIEVNAGIIGPTAPRTPAATVRRPEDYPAVPAAYLRVAQHLANPLLVGPPLCDELVALVQHMLSDEEADLMQHIATPAGSTAHGVARAAHRPVEEVRPILERLLHEKCVLFSFGSGSHKRYGLLPLVPGIFESVMVRTSTDTLTEWHRRFAECFEDLYETGYLTAYGHHPVQSVRYLPVAQASPYLPQAVPADRLESVLDGHTSFAVGLCQCRITETLVGRGCERPLETCLGYGEVVEPLIASGRMRRAEKQEVLELKAEAEAQGLVTFVSDLFQNTSGSSCSCCGCCCHAMRLVNEFNAPGLLAPPHFVPRFATEQCTACGKCARACPMGAIVVDARGKSVQHLAERCIGCGLCATACHRQAITMEEAPDYRRPPTSTISAVAQALPNYLRNAWDAWRRTR
jgi:Pyruvate/2-oxoacid:ferredoxin oxidoreductase delta subunit